MNLLTTLLTIMSLTISFQQTKCQCEKVSKEETTYWGWQKVILRGETVIGKIYGQALDPLDKPMSGVLVEVFSDPDVLLMEPSPEREKRERNQRRIAACKTGQNGKFCFAGISLGRYELRCSKKGYDAPQMIIMLDPKTNRRSSRGITVSLPVSK